MDKGGRFEQHILADAIKAMEPLGLRFRLLKQERGGDPRPDATLALRFGGRDLRYVAEAKRGLRLATLGAVIHQVRAARGGNSLLVADHVTPPLADALRAQGIEFIDTAGNAFLNQPPLLVFVKGQRPVEERPALERGRAFQATGLQVLFVLLARPELLARPYREIAAAAGVAHGTVGWVMAELPGLGYVAKVGGRRRLINAERLFDRWTEAYARTLRPKLLLGRYRGDLGALQQATRWPDGVLIGGELAAARLTRHLRPGTATFYGEAIDPKALLKLALKADTEGNVDFRRRFWSYSAEEAQLTPNLLVYADLLAIVDAPCLETAQLLRGPLLARLV